MARGDIEKQLAKVEHLAQSSKWQRFFYAPLPYLTAALFNKVLYPITKKAWRRSCQTAYGLPFVVALPAGTDIYLTGGKTHDSERQLARYLANHLKAGMTYVDVGAHYGYFVGLAASLNPSGQTIAFEPSPSTFQLLSQNMKSLPSGCQVVLHQQGLADQAGQRTFYQFPARYSEYNSLDISQYQDEKWLTTYPPTPVLIQITTLDEALDQIPHILKIDVEGAEDLVLQGAEKWLTQQKTAVVLEYLPTQKSNGSHQRAHRWLLEKGYLCHRITPLGEAARCHDPEQWLSSIQADSANLLYLPTAVAA